MVEHKDPKDRAHFWERPLRADEDPAVAAQKLAVDHEYPRHLHKGLGADYQSLIVSTRPKKNRRRKTASAATCR